MAFLVRRIAFLLILLAFAFPAWGQDSNGIGVVTALTGRADLTRFQAPKAALKRRDHLFVRDVVDTYEASLARILLMGKSSVTVREFSRFEIREDARPGPGRRAVIDLVVGKIRVMVARKLMKPGDEVEIRTPNVFAGVRGTDGIFEVTTLPDGTTRTVVTGISGEFEVRLPSSRALTAMAAVVADAGPGVRLAQIQVIRIGRGDRLVIDPGQVVKSVLSPADVQQLILDFRVSIAATGVRPVGWPAPAGVAAGLRLRMGQWPLPAEVTEIAQNPSPEPIVGQVPWVPTTPSGGTPIGLQRALTSGKKKGLAKACNTPAAAKNPFCK